MRDIVWRNRVRLAIGWLLLSLHQACEAAVPIAIGVTIDVAVDTGDPIALAWCVGGIVALFTVLALAWRFGSRFGVTAMQNEIHRVRMLVASRALDPRGITSGNNTGETLSLATSDAEKTALIVRAVSMGIAATVALVVSATALLRINLTLGLSVLIGVPLLLGALQALAPWLSRRSADAQEATASATGVATDLVTGLRTLRGIGATDNGAVRYRTASRAALNRSLSAANSAGVFQGVTTALSGLFLAGIASFAGWFALTDRISVGELVTIVGLAQFIAEPMQTLGYCGQIAAIARGSARRVVEMLNTAPLVEDHGTAAPSPDAPTVIELEEVSYRGLSKLNLSVGRDEVLGIVCHDPGDADALLALLGRRAAPNDHTGEIRVGGVPIADIDLATLREFVHLEPHQADLFEGTLADNLAARLPADAPVDAIDRAVSAAAATDVVAAHPDGLERRLTDRGASLSGGQRQRIGVARALVAAPRVLVLHDATTAIDAATEERLAEGLIAMRGLDDDAGLATVAITSSPALLGKAHRVVVIDGGRIVADGVHSDLIDRVESYRTAVLR